MQNGLTFREIAAELDYSVGYMHKVFTNALRKIPAQAVEDYRADQLARIQLERQALLDILAAHHVVVSNGHIVSEIVGHYPLKTDNGEDHPLAGQPIFGEPLVDSAPVMQAVDRLIKLDDQEAKLVGAYAATKIDATVAVRYEVIGVDPADIA